MYDPTLLYGDCLELMKSLDSRSVDLIIADPPYNLGKDYGNGSDSRLRADYLNFTRHWLQEATRVLKHRGSIYVFMGFRFISHLFNIMEQQVHLQFNRWICWYYTQEMGRTKGFSPRHDDILLFTASEDFTFNLDAVRVPQKYYRSVNNMRGANPGDVWEFSHVNLIKKRLAEPFKGFDGIDPRMMRIPNDLNDPAIRAQYKTDHKRWFLKNHENELEAFEEAFKRKYPHAVFDPTPPQQEPTLFDQTTIVQSR